MEQHQLQFLQAMGISCWQSRLPGEQGAPQSLSLPPPHRRPTRLIVAQETDVSSHRALIQSVLNAVGWQACDYLLVDDQRRLSASHCAQVQYVWWLGNPRKEREELEHAAHLESASLAKMNVDRTLKAELWKAIQHWRLDN